MKPDNPNCHCGSGTLFRQCCLPILNKTKLPSNAEQLMRSRFSAFKLHQHQYILDTQNIKGEPKTTIDSFDLSIEWLGLYVLAHHTNSQQSKEQVEFVAFFKPIQSNKVEQLHELSDFEITGHRWLYIAGQQLANYKIPRNIECFCQSGKKYKKCHAVN